MFVAIIIVLVMGTFGVLSLPQFGKKASGLRRKRIQNSPNFKDGKFQNLSYTPDINEDFTYFDLFKEFIKKHKDKVPAQNIPSLKTNLHAIDVNKNSIVWFGHSSYLMYFEGKRILVDPVFSGFAAPFSFMMNAFKGSNLYRPEDIPEIDILIITHDHYDHLDFKTLKVLKSKVKVIVTSLGVGEHLEHWGVPADKLIELDWHEHYQLPGLEIIAQPARHFSGRGLTPKTTLWSSFVLKGKNSNIYIGGDSGYDTHFKSIGAKHGPFDLVILDGGQYNLHWKDIHMVPEETVQAAIDLQAKKLLPVHWAKFPLAHHAWYEPAQRVTAACELNNMPYFIPKIGEVSHWATKQGSEKWWA
jgi:L-ascorbate metabolism protein UlaG (beta-lactamase superfamily)